MVSKFAPVPKSGRGGEPGLISIYYRREGVFPQKLYFVLFEILQQGPSWLSISILVHRIFLRYFSKELQLKFVKIVDLHHSCVLFSRCAPSCVQFQIIINLWMWTDWLQEDLAKKNITLDMLPKFCRFTSTETCHQSQKYRKWMCLNKDEGRPF